MRTLTIAARWEIYRRTVVPSSADERRVFATKVAFYSGCFAVLDVLEEIADMDDAEFERRMESLSEEVQQFQSTMIARYACGPVH